VVAKYDWVKIRDAFEIEGLSYAKITKKFGVAKATISEKVKKEGWIKGKAEHIISSKVLNIKEKNEIEQRTEQEFGGRSDAINKEVENRLRLEGLFTNSLEYNQKLANKTLKKLAENAELQDLNLHSQITNRNKDGIIGKMPQTQVNIQNTVATDADDKPRITRSFAW